MAMTMIIGAGVMMMIAERMVDTISNITIARIAMV